MIFFTRLPLQSLFVFLSLLPCFLSFRLSSPLLFHSFSKFFLPALPHPSPFSFEALFT